MKPPTALTPAPVTPPPALRGAPCSATVTVRLAGKEVLVTLRGTDDAEVLARVAQVLARYPDPTSASQPFAHVGAPRTSPPPAGTTPQCPQHGAMRQGKGGHWFCPCKTADGAWCATKA
jgi:hypothetical protein